MLSAVEALAHFVAKERGLYIFVERIDIYNVCKSVEHFSMTLTYLFVINCTAHALSPGNCANTISLPD